MQDLRHNLSGGEALTCVLNSASDLRACTMEKLGTSVVIVRVSEPKPTSSVDAEASQRSGDEGGELFREEMRSRMGVR